MRTILVALLIFAAAVTAGSQTLSKRAEAIRSKYKIPELSYAVVTENAVLDTGFSGYKRAGMSGAAERLDRFHLGSNTKAITAFVAALLVKQGKLKWDTRFFELYPELSAKSDSAYGEVTLHDLLCFRAPLPKYTYTNEEPRREDMPGDYAAQRYYLAGWLIRQKPVGKRGDYAPTNASFILAGLMLEKASGKSYKELVTELGKLTGIDFEFDYPNLTGERQPWGHDANLLPVAPAENYKLNWLLSAGNINVDLPGYIKFIQLQMKGLSGHSDLLDKKEFEFLYWGAEEFSSGWFWKSDKSGHAFSTNTGNAGAFITEVHLRPDADRAYIIFTNSATEKTSAGIAVLFRELMKKYGK
jgi:CubicO group peptidase (beta-lactamase class C family)